MSVYAEAFSVIVVHGPILFPSPSYGRPRKQEGFPKGGSLPGELLVDTCKREVLEETNIVFDGKMDFIRLEDGTLVHVIEIAINTVYFICKRRTPVANDPDYVHDPMSY